MVRLRGFTALELVSLIIVLGVASLFATYQFNDFQKITDDQTRKTAINAIHHSLEEVYYKENRSYPEKIDTTILPSVTPALFKDPSGRQINTTGANYQYEPIRCTDAGCKAYYLYTDLEKESRYEKRSN